MSENINLVVGAGFSGAVIAENIAQNLNEKVLLIDKKDHIAGNSYDYMDNSGITVHKYGSHIFHTNNERVWSYLNKFANFSTYMHRVYAVIDGIKTTIPFNFNTLYDVFPSTLAKRLEEKLLISFEYNSKVPILKFQTFKDKDLNFLADYIYNKVFLNYTKKQWGADPQNVDSAVTARVPVLISKDNRYFQDRFQGIPYCGYTKLIHNMINHPNIETRLKTDYKDINYNSYKRIFYTGSIDEFFDYKFGMLPYRSVNFKYEEHDCEFYQNNSVVNYPNNYDFTRIHEFKHFLKEKSPVTLIAKEYSENYKQGLNERYYPIASDESRDLYNKYNYLAKEHKNLYFLGRLGDYKYYDMDKAIERALLCFDKINENQMPINLTTSVTQNNQGGNNDI